MIYAMWSNTKDEIHKIFLLTTFMIKKKIPGTLHEVYSFNICGVANRLSFKIQLIKKLMFTRRSGTREKMDNT